MTWVEVHLEVGVEPRELYDWLGTKDMAAASVHHFYDEPWNPKAFVVRLKDLEGNWREIEGCSLVSGVYTWDAVPDEKLYGATWPTVQQFFQASSLLSTAAPDDYRWHLKLVHCYLNAQEMSEYEEARFAWRLFWNRLTIRSRFRWLRFKLRVRRAVTL